MPNKVVVMKVARLEYDIYFEDNNGSFIGLAYPGMYAGLGKSFSEALLMAELRYRSGRRTFFEARKDATLRDWDTYAEDREVKFKEIYKAKGISDSSCWTFKNVEITKKGNA